MFHWMSTFLIRIYTDAKGKKVSLFPVEQEDLKEFRDWRNNLVFANTLENIKPNMINKKIGLMKK